MTGFLFHIRAISTAYRVIRIRELSHLDIPTSEPHQAYPKGIALKPVLHGYGPAYEIVIQKRAESLRVHKNKFLRGKPGKPGRIPVNRGSIIRDCHKGTTQSQSSTPYA